MQFLPLAPLGWPQDVQKRYPNHLWMQKSGVPKKLVVLRKSKVFSSGIPVKIPLFRSEAATASHLDSKIQSDPWVTPLPHSTKNKKKHVFVFFFLPSSAPTLFSDIPPAQGPTNPVVNQALLFKKHHLRISGCLFGDISSVFTRSW